MDYFDLAVEYGGSLSSAFGALTRASASYLYQRLAVSDLGKPRTGASIERRRGDVSFVEIETDNGDSFLLHEPELSKRCAASSPVVPSTAANRSW
jgi:hypothetical protein